MSNPNLRWTPLQPRQLVTFYDPSNPTTSFTPQNNPATVTHTPNSVRKYTETVNGGAIVLGDKEYPPKEIGLTWNQLDDSDFQALKGFSYLYPIVFVDNNDCGYLGCLVFDSVEQAPNLVSKVWKVKASFLVIAPYDGIKTPIPKLVPPVLNVSFGTNGYIANTTEMFFWTTVVSRTGESTIGSLLTVTAPADSSSFQLTFIQPTNIYYLKTRIYWSNQAIASNASFLADSWPGEGATFTVYGPYFNYSLLNPPTYNIAFTGYWAGGLWIPDATGGSVSGGLPGQIGTPGDIINTGGNNI